jgi:hypothetical protein
MANVPGNGPSGAQEGSKKKDSSTERVDSQLKDSGEVVVEHHPLPPPGPADLTIHKRSPLPPVPTAPSPPIEDKENK